MCGALNSLNDTLTSIVGEANTKGGFHNFLLEEVCLVEEEHHGGSVEELVVADAVEQMEALVHAILMETGRATGGNIIREKVFT